MTTPFLLAQEPKLVLPIGHTSKVNAAVFSPDGKKVITASEDRTAKIWDVATGNLLADLKGHKGALAAARFSSDGKKIITQVAIVAYEPEFIIKYWYKLWDANTGTAVDHLRILDSSLTTFPEFSTNGNKIIITTDSVRIWNTTDGLKQQTIGVDAGTVNTALFDPQDRWVYIADTNRKISVWSAATGKQVHLLAGYTAPIKAIQFSSDKKRIITASANETIIWNADSWTLIRKISGKIDGDEIFQLAPDGEKIITAGNYAGSSQAKLWVSSTRKLYKKFQGYNLITDPDNPMQQGFSFSGTVVAVSNRKVATALNLVWYNNLQMGLKNDNKVKIWDAATGALKYSLEGHTDAINYIQFSADGRLIITASDDRTAKIWDAETGNLVADLKGHAFNSRVLLFRPVATGDAALASEIVTSSDDGSLKLWDMTRGKLVSSLKAHEGDVYSLRFSSDGKKVISASRYGTVNIWDIEAGKKIILVKDPSFVIDPTADEPENDRISGLIAPELSPDGTKAVAAIHSSIASVYNTSNGKLLYTLKADNRRFTFIHFSPDGRKIIGGWIPEFPSSKGKDSTIQVWDAENGKPLFKISPYNIWMGDANFTPDGKRILIISETGGRNKILLCDAENGNPTDEWKNLSPWSGNVQFSNDGTKTVICGLDSASIVETKTGRQLATIKTREELVETQFSHDGKKMAVILKGGESEVWDIEKGIKVFDLTGHTDKINFAQFNPDNKTVITTSKDNTAKVWDVNSGKCLYTFFSLDSSDYFNLLPNGYYHGTVNAAKLLHYVTTDLHIISFEQLDVKYNRPDKVFEVAGKMDTAMIKPYRMAYEKRIKRLGVDTLSFKDGYSVPEADFVNQSSMPAAGSNEKLALHIKAMDKVYNLEYFNVWINEVPVYGMRGISIKNRKSGVFDTTINVSLSRGENRIETSVRNINGTESYRKPLLVKYLPPVAIVPKVYFVGIGINNFADSSNNLKWCVQDIRDLVKTMKLKYKSQLVVFDTLFNERVTVAQVKALKQKLLTTGINDKVIISYSGHGLLSKSYDYYLSSYTVNFSNPEENGIPYEEIENLLDGIPARQKILLLDACHSGEVDKEDLQVVNKAGENLLTKNTVIISGKKGGIVTNTDDGSGKIGLQNSFDLMQSLFVNAGRGTGATIISASGGVQFAQERSDLGHGVFTYSVIEAMKKFKSIKISALRKYVGDRVLELTNGLQKPTARSEMITIDWNVW